MPGLQNGERIVSLTNCAEKIKIYMQKNEIRPLPYTIHKNQSKWIKDLNVKIETIQLLKEYIGEKVS